MALVLADRVRDTTTTTGTGTITLSGLAPNGYQTFGSAIGNGNSTYYTIVGTTEWEVGIGTYTSSGTTLSRDTVLASSNSGSLVSFSAGSKDVFVTYPAGRSVQSAAPTITGLREVKVAISASNIDLSLGNYFSKTISTTTTFTVSNTPSSGTAASFILDLTDGGSATVNWWSGMKWAGGTAPTLTTSGRDVLGFFTYDGGTTWSGFVLGLDVK